MTLYIKPIVGKPGEEKARSTPRGGGGLFGGITRELISQANDLAVGNMKDNMVGITDVAPSAEEAAPTTYEYKDFQFDGDTFWQEYMASERERLGIKIGDDGFAVLPESISGAPLNEAEKNDWNRYLESLKGTQGAMMRRGANTYTPMEIREVLSEWKGGASKSSTSSSDSSSRYSPTKRYNTRRYGKERGASRVKSDRERISRATRDRQDRQRSSMSRY